MAAEPDPELYSEGWIEKTTEESVKALQLEAWKVLYQKDHSQHPSKLFLIETVYPGMIPQAWGAYSWHATIYMTIRTVGQSPDEVPPRAVFEKVLAKTLVGLGYGVMKDDKGTICPLIRDLNAQKVDV